MYVVMNRVMVKADWAEEFEQRFNKRKGQIDKEPGFVSMEILQPESENTPFVVMTHWETKADFENWIHSEDFKIAHQNPMPKEAFNPGGGLERFNVVISSKST